MATIKISVSLILKAWTTVSCISFAQGARLPSVTQRPAALSDGLTLETSHYSARSTANVSCRYLPGDAGYPDQNTWEALNQTIEGRLIQGIPLARVCYGSGAKALAAECSAIKQSWSTVDPL